MKNQVKTIKIKKVKKMTIEDLALMVARGFESIPTREEMNARFDEIERKFNGRCDEMEKKFIDRFDRIEFLLIRALENRTEKLEDEVRVLKTTVERILKKV